MLVPADQSTQADEAAVEITATVHDLRFALGATRAQDAKMFADRLARGLLLPDALIVDNVQGKGYLIEAVQRVEIQKAL